MHQPKEGFPCGGGTANRARWDLSMVSGRYRPMHDDVIFPRPLPVEQPAIEEGSGRKGLFLAILDELQAFQREIASKSDDRAAPFRRRRKQRARSGVWL